MPEPIRSILIVGGGTAGWMAAAALKRAVGPHCEVRLVESAEIGIVGVGEATVPTIRTFNAMIGLDEAEFMRATQASLKLGIEFVGWGREGSTYFHPFGVFGVGNDVAAFAQSWLRLKAEGRSERLEAYSICAQAALRGRAGETSADPNSPMNGYQSAFHFDASLYARYLRGFCERIGVERVEGEIVEVIQRPEDGFIDRVRLKDGRELAADLFIDCTGFRGLLIEGALKAGYDDWSHWLPVDRAVAAPCARVGPTTPFTRSTAAEAGWRWRIPLQHRVGNGYVFASNWLSEERAKDDLVAALDGELLAEPRVLRFLTGRRRKLWDRNVVALGLSSGFIEPLESTSIHMIHVGIAKLLQHFPDKGFSPANIEIYNRRVGREVEHVRDFVILHYHATQRRDSDFWRHVADQPIPDSLAEKIEAFRDRGLLYALTPDEYFQPTSWLAVMQGQGIEARGHNPLYDLGSLDRLAEQFTRMQAGFARAAEALPMHDDHLRQAGLSSPVDA